jgi:hypothetical protein
VVVDAALHDDVDLDGRQPRVFRGFDARGFGLSAFDDKALDTLLADVALDMITLRLGPSLRVMRGRFGTASLDDRHAVAVEALRVGDIPAVGDAIRLDIEQGFNQIRLSMRD